MVSWRGSRYRGAVRECTMYQQQCVPRLLAPPNLRLREALVCGAPQFVDEAGDVLARLCVSREQLHMEQC